MSRHRSSARLAVLLAALGVAQASSAQEVFPGADQRTPSRSYYFDWINSQYEGTTEAQTLINLEFWAWLHDEYGVELDVYTLDVGNVDDGPYTAGVGRLIPHHCGTLDSREFREQFPRGFAPLVEKAASFGCRLGIWLGPDGFGETPEEERARADMLIDLCRDHDFLMFKLDGVAGGLRPEKQEILARTLAECRRYCPDLLVLNERIDLGAAEPHATTSLWEGAETYIDVFNCNSGTAIHHRAGTLDRGLVPGMDRLIEDHGVCLSSCLDFWEDDFVLQAFNRCLILAPEIYGSPWFLRDDEIPKLARLWNLHRRHREILVDGLILSEEQYGPHAVSRGDERARLLTLRNPSWEPVGYELRLGGSIGLGRAEEVELRRLHPSERIHGRYEWGAKVDVTVPPFRSCLLLASSAPIDEIGIIGCEYEVIRDVPGKPVIVDLLRQPGLWVRARVDAGKRTFTTATLDGEDRAELLGEERVPIRFPGRPLQEEWHRKLADLSPCELPEDAEGLFEATCFAADSNALEARSLLRAGPSAIPPVQAARDAFVEQPMFVQRGIWDRNLLDGDLGTFFVARLEGRALRLDLGEPTLVDELVLRTRSRYEPDLAPSLSSFAGDAAVEVSADLSSWHAIPTPSGKGSTAILRPPKGTPVRYLRVDGAPRRIAEIEGHRDGAPLDRSRWRVSNLFPAYRRTPAVAAFSASITLEEVPRGSYLAIPIEGRHGDEGAWAALRIGGELVGAPDRAVSFPSNTWEYYNVERESGYTYFFPLTEDAVGREIEVFVLVLEGGGEDIRPSAWITAHPPPYERKRLVLGGER